jgi:hypothetical protein
MSKFAITVLMLAGATALAAAPIAAPANAVTHSGMHLKKHSKKHQWGPGGPVFAEASRRASNYSTHHAWPDVRTYSRAGHTCFRAVDCAQWPPAIEQDPDRKTAGEGM